MEVITTDKSAKSWEQELALVHNARKRTKTFLIYVNVLGLANPYCPY